MSLKLTEITDELLQANYFSNDFRVYLGSKKVGYQGKQYFAYLDDLLDHNILQNVVGGTYHLSQTAYNAASLFDISGGYGAGDILQYNGANFVAVEPAGIDTSAIHSDVANEISGLTEKVTPADNDLLIIEDSADGYAKKKVKKSAFAGGLWQIGSGVGIGTTNLITKGTVEMQSQATDDIQVSYNSSNVKRFGVQADGVIYAMTGRTVGFNDSIVITSNTYSVGANLVRTNIVGYDAGIALQVGSYNINLFGNEAGKAITTGHDIDCYGYQSGKKITTGIGIALHGSFTGTELTTQTNFSAFGYQSGYQHTGSGCTFVGANSGQTGSGTNTTAVGWNSGNAIGTGSASCYFGVNTGRVSTGTGNAFFGMSSGFLKTSGNYNTYCGYSSGHDSTTGTNCVFLGAFSGYYETGSRVILISSLTDAEQVNEATARTKAMFYGVESTTTANSKLTINAKLNVSQLPTSSAGLVTGDVWNNAGVLNIV